MRGDSQVVLLVSTSSTPVKAKSIQLCSYYDKNQPYLSIYDNDK